MTVSHARNRSLLLEAFQREGIDYPAERLDEAVEDFSRLRDFLNLIRGDQRASQEQPDVR